MAEIRGPCASSDAHRVTPPLEHEVLLRRHQLANSHVRARRCEPAGREVSAANPILYIRWGAGRFALTPLCARLRVCSGCAFPGRS